MKKIRETMFALGLMAGFLGAGFSDGEVLLSADAGATPYVLIAVSVLLMLPAIIHFYNRGEI